MRRRRKREQNNYDDVAEATDDIAEAKQITLFYGSYM